MLLVATDLHFTDQPDDNYRFGLLPWLNRLAGESKDKERVCLILGDLTDKKNRHDALLVNRITSEIEACDHITHFIILKGNHDYIEETVPFFKFLDNRNQITFVIDPQRVPLPNGKTAYCIPHIRKNDEFDAAVTKAIASYKEDKYDYLLLHQTFTGAQASNGSEMKGVYFDQLAPLHKKGVRILSGDIHVPQDLGPLTYVGSPYAVHFGDTFKPRCMVITNKGLETDVRYPAPKKRSVALKPDAGIPSHLKKGDHVKIQVMLPREEFHQWELIRASMLEKIKARGLLCFGLEIKEQKPKEAQPPLSTEKETPAQTTLNDGDVVNNFVAANKIDSDVAEMAKKIMERSNDY